MTGGYVVEFFFSAFAEIPCGTYVHSSTWFDDGSLDLRDPKNRDEEPPGMIDANGDLAVRPDRMQKSSPIK
jgi:hypothetical protein